MKKILFSIIVMLAGISLLAQPNIHKNIYFAEKFCSDSFFAQPNFYFAHSNGGKYSTYWDGLAQVFAKLDNNWDTVFTVKYQGNDENRADKILELPNGNILVAGTTRSDDNGYMYGYSNRAAQVWLMELDTMGSFVKAETFGMLALLTDVSITSDGHILLAGNTNGDAFEFTHPPNGNAQCAWIAKYDTAFNKVWIKIYDNNEYDGWPTIKEVTQERYMVGFMSDGTDAGAVPAETRGMLDLIVYYIDSSANLIWQHRYGTPQHDGTKLSVVDPNTKDVYFINDAGNNGGDITWFSGQCWIHKVDTFGIIKGSKAYGGTAVQILLDALWFSNRLWIFSQSAGNANGTDMEVNTGAINATDSWCAVIDTNVNLVAKYTLQSYYSDHFYDAFIYANELYTSGNIVSPVNVPYKCDTANSFKFVFKIGLAPLGVYETDQTTRQIFEIYPNPTNNTLYVKIAENYLGEKGELIVTDIEGRTVYRKNVKHLMARTELDCREWESGNYLIQLVINKSIQSTKKFSKQ